MDLLAAAAVAAIVDFGVVTVIAAVFVVVAVAAVAVEDLRLREPVTSRD